MYNCRFFVIMLAFGFYKRAKANAICLTVWLYLSLSLCPFRSLPSLSFFECKYECVLEQHCWQ